MKNLRRIIQYSVVLAVSLFFTQGPLKAETQGGIRISPTIFEVTEDTNEYNLEITNNEDAPISFLAHPWLFEREQERIIPLTEEKIKKFDTRHIELSTNNFTLQPGQTESIEVKFQKDKLSTNLFSGVIIKSEGPQIEEKITKVLTTSSIIFYRGDKSKENLELTVISAPKITFTNSIDISYKIQNRGGYIPKPTGEISVQEDQKKKIDNIAITSKIYKNIFLEDSIENIVQYNLPKKTVLGKFISRYDMELNINSSSGENYKTSTSTYYINPLVPIASAILASSLAIIIIKRKKLI